MQRMTLNSNTNTQNTLCNEVLQLQRGTVSLIVSEVELDTSTMALLVCANATKEGLKSLYWSIGNSINIIGNKVRDIKKFYDFDETKFEFAIHQPISSTQTNPKNKLREEMEKVKDCDVVILDNLTLFGTCNGFRNLNSANYGDVQAFINTLANIATTNNQAILIIDSVYPCQTIMNSFENVFSIELPNGENRVSTCNRIINVLKSTTPMHRKEIKLFSSADANISGSFSSGDNSRVVNSGQSANNSSYDSYINANNNRGKPAYSGREEFARRNPKMNFIANVIIAKWSLTAIGWAIILLFPLVSLFFTAIYGSLTGQFGIMANPYMRYVNYPTPIISEKRGVEATLNAIYDNGRMVFKSDEIGEVKCYALGIITTSSDISFNHEKTLIEGQNYNIDILEFEYNDGKAIERHNKCEVYLKNNKYPTYSIKLLAKGEATIFSNNCYGECWARMCPILKYAQENKIGRWEKGYINERTFIDMPPCEAANPYI